MFKAVWSEEKQSNDEVVTSFPGQQNLLYILQDKHYKDMCILSHTSCYLKRALTQNKNSTSAKLR